MFILGGEKRIISSKRKTQKYSITLVMFNFFLLQGLGFGVFIQYSFTFWHF